MTCEVAVMNKRGIALAADSAVTVTDGNGNKKKIYHTAEKLFQLSPALPVAIMTYGPADIMGVPWETVVMIYAQKLDGQRFDTLEEYANDFLSFIERTDWLFPADLQARQVQSLVQGAWNDLYKDELEKKLKERPGLSKANRLATLEKIIESDHDDWLSYDNLDTVQSDYGDLIVTTYKDAIDGVEQKVFEGMKLPAALKSALRRTVGFMYEKKWFHSVDQGHIVIAGMGETEPFPVLLKYRVGTVAAGKLRYAKDDETRTGETSDASVIPFAQSDIIHTIIQGIHPRVYQQIVEGAVGCLTDGGASKKPKNPTLIKKKEGKLRKYVRDNVLEQYSEPFMDAVSALPRKDLARMAEALVNLTAFLMRMTAGEDETVAEPIDVALLSKGDGFIWVKHKDVGR